MRLLNLARALALAAAAAVPALAQDAPPAEPGKATTPEACIHGMIACVRKGDIKGMAAFIAEPAGPKVVAMGDGMMSMQNATEKVAKAADAKFGPGTADSVGIKVRKPPEPGKIDIVSCKQEGDAATVTTKETKKDGTPGKEETLHLKKVGDFWFVAPQKEDKAFGEQQLAMAEVMSGAMKQAGVELDALAADIDAGKVATKEDLRTRYMTVQMNMGQVMMKAAQRKPEPAQPAPAPKPEPAPPGSGE